MRMPNCLLPYYSSTAASHCNSLAAMLTPLCFFPSLSLCNPSLSFLLPPSNSWDKRMRNVDVVDDYHSEKKEVLAAQGSNFKFTFGDYIVKILVRRK